MDDSHIQQLFDEIEDIIRVKDKVAIGRLKRGLRQAMRIVDAASQAEYAKHRYRYGAGKHKHKERGGRFRDFASKATAYRYRFNVAKGNKPWRYQSMMKRKGRDNTYQGNLSHLLEDGAWNVKYQKQNRAYKVRYTAFQKSRSAALARAIRAFKEAIGVGS
jgi:ribosomal protein L18